MRQLAVPTPALPEPLWPWMRKVTARPGSAANAKNSGVMRLQTLLLASAPVDSGRAKSSVLVKIVKACGPVAVLREPKLSEETTRRRPAGTSSVNSK